MTSVKRYCLPLLQQQASSSCAHRAAAAAGLPPVRLCVAQAQSSSQAGRLTAAAAAVPCDGWPACLPMVMMMMKMRARAGLRVLSAACARKPRLLRLAADANFVPRSLS